MFDDFNKEENMKQNVGSDAIYGLGVIGALVYFIQHATSFSAGILGLFKAVFWPAVVLYRVLEILKM